MGHEFELLREMEPLAFLLGKWEGSTIVYPASGLGEPERGDIHGEVRAALGGAWFEWEYFHRPNEAESLVRHARYSFGYSPGLNTLMAVYADDRGNAFTEYASGPDWVDGHLAFHGVMALPGKGSVGFIDDFTRPSAGRFVNTVTMSIDGEWHLHGKMDVKRVSPGVR